MRPLALGVACFPTIGGSGTIAREIGLAMARRGHRVHFVGAEAPRRLDLDAPNVAFHPVRARDYPALGRAPYDLALASTLATVAEEQGLDLLHAHYAVPHAASAWMAREMLGGRVRVVTTLHGSDVTLLGADEVYRPIVRHVVTRSDAVTTPSRFLRAEALARLGLDPVAVPIDVVPNFVDTDTWRPLAGAARPRLEWLFGADAARVPVIAHVSNFRPVKRVDLVVEVFARIAARRPARLLLVGDGPTRAGVEERLRRHGLADRARLVGSRDDVATWVREASVFLLPSESESFGLAALEALASGVPVVASAVGGLPEVVKDGETGFLRPGDDVDALAAAVDQLLDDPPLRARFAAAARDDVLARFRAPPVLDRYEALYREVLARPPGARPAGDAALRPQ